MVEAWQSKVRKQKAVEPPKTLFGAFWEGLNLNLKDARVRRVSRKTASTIILEYEWLGNMPAICVVQYGIYFDGVLGGAAVFSPEYGENLGVWDSYGFTGKILLLSRGACAFWTPKNSASYLISRALKDIEQNTHYRIITATIDRKAGEVGTIYQALNWHYVGAMSSAQHQRAEYAGRIVEDRQLRRLFGTANPSKIKEKYPTLDIEFLDYQAKERYFCFLGPRRERRQYLAAIQHLIKSYPKRREISEEEDQDTECG